MEKKNHLITTKPFEEFKSDNVQFYASVVKACKDMLAYLSANGVKRNEQKMVDAGNWEIEGKIVKSDLISADNTLSVDLFFHDKSNENEYIIIDITGQGKTIPDKPGDYTTPPDFESESNLDVNSITYYHDSFDYVIAVTKELEALVLEITEFIAE